MPNFEENIQIKWDISDPERNAQSLIVATEKMRAAMADTTRTFVTAATEIASSYSAIAASLDSVIAKMETLNSLRGAGGKVVEDMGGGFTRTSYIRQQLRNSGGEFASYSDLPPGEGTGGGGLGPYPGGYYSGSLGMGHGAENLQSRLFQGPLGLLPDRGLPDENQLGKLTRQQSMAYEDIVPGLSREASQVATDFNEFGIAVKRTTNRWMETFEVSPEEAAKVKQAAALGAIYDPQSTWQKQYGTTTVAEAVPTFSNDPTANDWRVQTRSEVDANRMQGEQAVNMMEAQAAQARLADLQSGKGIPGSQFDFRGNDPNKALGEYEYAQYQKSLGGAEEGQSKFGASVLRTVSHLATLAVVLGTVRVAYGFVNEVTQDIIKLGDAEARLAYISGASGGSARAQLLGGATDVARYGVSPQSSYSGEIISQQYGAPAGTNETAAKIAFAFGETQNYNNVVQEVAQTVRRANGEFDDQGRILDLLATLYKSANLSMEGYFDSMQEAIPLSHLLGMSLEDTAILIARTAQTLEQTPTVAAGLFTKVIQRTNQSDVQEKLKSQFGIQGGGFEETVLQISNALQQFESSGNFEAADKLTALVSGGGGAQGRQDLLRLGTALREFNALQRENIETTGNWDKLMGAVGGTISASFVRLTGAAQAFINVWANTGGVKTFFDYLADRANEAAVRLELGAKTGLAQDEFSKLPQDEKLKKIQEFNAKMGYEAVTPYRGGNDYLDQLMGQGQITDINPHPDQKMIDQVGGLPGANLLTANDALKAAFYATMGGATATIPSGGYDIHADPSNRPAGPPGGAYTYREPLPFGGIQDLPEGMDPKKIQAAASAYESQLAGMAKAQNLDYSPKQETFWLYDKLTNSFKSVTTTSDALALAMKKAADATDNFGGFRDLPKGITFDAIQASVQTWTKRIKDYEPGTQDYEKDVRTAFWDEGTKTWKTITAPVDALRYAIDENTKKLNQITGTFNIPAGGEALVSFSALQAGFVPSDRVSGASGGAASAALLSSASGFGTAATQFTAAVRAFSDSVMRESRGGAYSDLLAAGKKNEPATVKAARDNLNKYLNDTLRSSASEDAARMDAGGVAGFRMGMGSGGGASFTATINNRIILDGRQIAAAMQIQMYKSSSQTRRSGSGGNSGAILV